MNEIIINREVDPSEVRAFYAKCGYGGELNSSDETIVARINGKVVGATRVCSDGEFKTVRGMQILEGFQRKGIGSKLLFASEQLLNKRVAFCLPHAYLERFYAKIGFERIDIKLLPQNLKSRFNQYRDKGLKVIAMRRSMPNKSLQTRVKSTE